MRDTERVNDRASSPYAERLTAPASWWVGAAGFALAIAWIVLVATTTVAAIVAGAVVLGGLGLLVHRFGSLLVRVDDAGLHVGRAVLDPSHLGTVTSLHRVEYRELLGPSADARAYLVTRPYLDRGVRVDVHDPSDPTPYWLVSTRRPDALAAAVAALTDQEPARGEA